MIYLAAPFGQRSEGIDGIRNVAKVAGRTWVSLRYAVGKAQRRSWDCDDPPCRTDSELPLVGASHNLDPRSVRQVCEALDLDWSKFPGSEDRV